MYCMLLISADGQDFVTDWSGSKTPEDAEAAWADSGSRWIFYPYGVVIRDVGTSWGTGNTRFTNVLRKRIISAPMYGPLGYVTGTVKRMMDTIRENADELADYYNQ